MKKDTDGYTGSRLIDYYLHSREFAHVDRVKEEWVTVRKGSRIITVPESEARFFATATDGKDRSDTGIPGILVDNME